tara:strand:+ start:375 stop:923 length:549 start_codon:yes stop_codon:yes gene_type:complete
MKKYQEGFTLLEMATTMTLMSIVLMSLIYISGEAMYFFDREILKEEVQHYANSVLDEITDQISTAPKVKLSVTQNSRKIACEFDSVTYVYTGDHNKGILKDGKPLPTLRFNEYRGQDYRLELKEFDCTPALSVTETNSPLLHQSVYTVEMVIDAVYDKKDKSLRDRHTFKRQIFARSKYASG